MSYTPFTPIARSNYDTSGRTRVSQLTTLFDGKILNVENINKWDTKGTGTATYSNNSINLSVTSGQYIIRQSKFFTPYFSGKPQLIESTFINFINESGVTKRAGYFSSSNVAPYVASLDGVWLESDGSTYRLMVSNLGTITHNIPWTSWDDYNSISSYDWSKFTVNEIDFLWLGGAALRLFLVVNGEFRLVHTIKNHAGYATSLIVASPNQPMRYEVRSSTGSGSMVAVCSQIASEGTSAEQGESIAVSTIDKVCNTVGVNYLLCAARKSSAYRNNHIRMDYFTSAVTGGTADSGIMFLCLNPTYSAPLVWTQNSKIEESTAGAQTVTNLGRILCAIPIVSVGMVQPAPLSALSTLLVGIDNTMGELALVYRPTTPTQTISGTMMFLEY
jgi:hypothetical protein